MGIVIVHALLQLFRLALEGRHMVVDIFAARIVHVQLELPHPTRAFLSGKGSLKSTAPRTWSNGPQNEGMPSNTLIRVVVESC